MSEDSGGSGLRDGMGGAALRASSTAEPRRFVIAGIMAAGKSTVAQLLAEALPKSVHLRGDIFRKMVVHGYREMEADPSPEAEAHLTLRYRAAAAAADLYLEAGFSVVYQDVIVGPKLEEVLRHHARQLHLVVLCPSAEVVAQREAARGKRGYREFTPAEFDRAFRATTPRLGLWLDTSELTPEETVERILDDLDASRVEESESASAAGGAPVRRDPPRLCLFDLGGVAARFEPERRLPELARLLGASAEAVTERVWSSGLAARLDAGEFRGESMAAELGALFGRTIAFSELSRIWCRAFEPDPEVLALARRLGDRTGVGLLTNNPPALEAGLPKHHPELAAHFDPLLFSCTLGAAKPSGEALLAVELRTGLAPEELALIDDSPAHVEAARARGWTALHFRGATSLERELTRLGWIEPR